MKLSIIIVSYNTKELLQDCLGSIEESLKKGKILNQVQNDNEQVQDDDILSPEDVEVIVVDNNSEDGTREWLEEVKSEKLKVKDKNTPNTQNSLNFLTIKTIFNEENVGFAKANNRGVEESEGEYTLLLNSDTKVIDNDFFAKVINYLENNQQVAVLGPKLLWENGQIQPSGGYFPSLGRLLAWALFLDDLPLIGKFIPSYHPHEPSFRLQNSSYYQKPHRQDWVTGAGFFVRRRVLDEVGGLDEKIFMYTEEMELCYRIKQAGYEVVYYPEAEIIHYGGKSGTSQLAVEKEFIGLKYFYQKHKSKTARKLLNLILLAAAVNRIVLFGIINKPEKRKIYQTLLQKL